MNRPENRGKITAIKEGILAVEGLEGCAVGERVILPEERVGVVLFLVRGGATVACLDAVAGLEIGGEVAGTGEGLRIPVGRGLVGEAIDPLGRSTTTGATIATEESRELRVPRAPLGAPIALSHECQLLDTGVLAIDSLAPLGRGGRLVVLGDQADPRTRFASEIARRQREKGVRVVYVYTGEAPPDELLAGLRDEEASEYLTLVWGGVGSLALSCLAPLAGLVIADEARARGEHVLLILDSLSRHQAACDRLREAALPAEFQALPPEPFVGWEGAAAALLSGCWPRSPASGGGSITGLFLSGKSPSLRIDGPESLKGWLYDTILILAESEDPVHRAPGAQASAAPGGNGAVIDGARITPGFPSGKVPPPRRRLRMKLRAEMDGYTSQLAWVARTPASWSTKLDDESRRIAHRGGLLRAIVAATTWVALSPPEQQLLCAMALEDHAAGVDEAALPGVISRVIEQARRPDEGILDHAAGWTPGGRPDARLQGWFARVLPPAPPAPALPPLTPQIEVTEGGQPLASRRLAPGSWFTLGQDPGCTAVVPGFPEARRRLFSASGEGALLRLPDGWEATVTSPGQPPRSAAELRSPAHGMRYQDGWLLLLDPGTTFELTRDRLRVSLRYQEHGAAPGPAAPSPGAPAAAPAVAPSTTGREPPRVSDSVALTVLKELFDQLRGLIRGR